MGFTVSKFTSYTRQCHWYLTALSFVIFSKITQKLTDNGAHGSK